MAGAAGICVVTGSESSAIQGFIAATAASLRAGGANVVGVIGEEHGLPDRTCGAGFLRDVASGARFSMYREVPEPGRTCHIDADGVEAACAAVLPQIAASDLVVLNKFGKLEAAGQGLWPVLAEAVAADKPVLLAVSGRHADAFRAFAPDAAVLPMDEAALGRWWDAVHHAEAAGRA